MMTHRVLMLLMPLMAAMLFADCFVLKINSPFLRTEKHSSALLLVLTIVCCEEEEVKEEVEEVIIRFR